MAPDPPRRSPLLSVFEWTIFPLIAGGGTVAAIWAIEAGYGPLRVYIVVQGLAVVTVALLARVVPYSRAWLSYQGDVPADAGHSVVSAVLVPELLKPFIHAAGIATAAWMAAQLGTGLWPEPWPLVAQLALALVVGEFGQYWVHRLEHERPWLWRFHATHHSAPRLYWLNAGRFHPVDYLFLYIAWYWVRVAAGAGIEVIALFSWFTAIHGIFQHCNLPVRLGPLNWVFSMAELHRWHHSRTIEESNANYGATMIVWDIVFGTRFLPHDRRPPEQIGIADLPNFPGGYFAQLLSPLRWSRVVSESRGPGGTA